MTEIEYVYNLLGEHELEYIKSQGYDIDPKDPIRKVDVNENGVSVIFNTIRNDVYYKKEAEQFKNELENGEWDNAIKDAIIGIHG